MICLVEANQSWLETITYQMCHMPYAEQAKHHAHALMTGMAKRIFGFAWPGDAPAA